MHSKQRGTTSVFVLKIAHFILFTHHAQEYTIDHITHHVRQVTLQNVSFCHTQHFLSGHSHERKNALNTEKVESKKKKKGKQRKSQKLKSINARFPPIEYVHIINSYPNNED